MFHCFKKKTTQKDGIKIFIEPFFFYNNVSMGDFSNGKYQI